MRFALAGSFALLASGLVFCASPVDAQQSGPVALRETRAPQRADSARALRGARQAQAAFERLRYRSLPYSLGGGSGGRCDEIIGRFCLWHNDDEVEENRWSPPPEPRPVKDGRDRLIGTLGDAAAEFPGEAWVAGQRVRYLVEAGRAGDAVTAARECRGDAWWCRALEGYALHMAGDYLAAEAAFDAAVAAMPERERREWTDLAPVLADGDARALRRMAPAERDSVTRRLWWLADPFWMQPGNDRRTEHFARLVADRFQDRARPTEPLAWADDLREILLRYGIPIGWEKIRASYGSLRGDGLVTHYAPDSYEFLPTLRQVREPLKIAPGRWKLEDGTRTAYAPASAASIDELPHQLAVFRRGDRVEVVAGVLAEHDSLPPAPELEAALVIARDELTPAVTAVAHAAGTRGALRASVAPESALVSVEARERTSRRAWRTRYAVDLRRAAGAGLALSDVLLLDDAAARPASLDEAAPRARGSTRFRLGERLGLYWEVYGLEPRADTLTLAVALTRKSVGGLRRTAEALGLARTAAPVRMRWSEETAGAPILPRTLAVAIPDVPPGDYVIEVTVRTRAGATATTTREITIAREERKKR